MTPVVTKWLEHAAIVAAVSAVADLVAHWPFLVVGAGGVGVVLLREAYDRLKTLQ